MSGLLGSELLRLASRRVVRVLALLAVGGILVGVAIGTVKSHPGGNGAELSLTGLTDVLKGSSFIMLVIALVVGASSAGADWQTGGFTTLLTWEPRRVRVLVARALVLAVGLFVIAIALQVLLSLAMAGGARLRGTTVGADSTWLRGVTGTILRIGIVSSISAVLGLAVATIGRNTSFALGAMFVYMAVLEGLLRGLAPSISNALLSTNLAVFIDGRPGGGATETLISVERALVTIALYTSAVLVVAVGWFRTRDVT